jgi:Bacterial Ig-like domain
VPGLGGLLDNVDGTVTLDALEITSPGSIGDGVINDGTMHVTNCTFHDISNGSDGGVLHSSGLLSVTNSTFVANTTFRNGGAISLAGGSARLVNDTIFNNFSFGDGGGIYVASGAVATLTNCLVAGNGGFGTGDISGTVLGSSSHNLIGNGTGLVGMSSGDGRDNLVGSQKNPLAPKLDTTLGNHGGPVPTLALHADSPAVNHGTGDPIDSDTHVPATDERGAPREGTPDIGAYELETNPPSVTLSSSAPSVTNLEQVPVAVHFSEPVTDFTSAGIAVDNGRVVPMTFHADANHQDYSVLITPRAQGKPVVVNVNAGVAHDLWGTGNAATIPLSLTIDLVPPTVALSSAAADPGDGAPIPVTVTFSEPVTDFTADDVTLSNGTLTPGSFHGSGTAFSFSVTPAGPGTVTVGIGAGVAHDAAGNGNTAADPLSRLVVLPPPPTPAPPAPAPQPAPAAKLLAVPVKVKGRFEMRLLELATGQVTLRLRFPGRVLVLPLDLNGDGVADFLLLFKQGKRWRRLGLSSTDGSLLPV